MGLSVLGVFTGNFKSNSYFCKILGFAKVERLFFSRFPSSSSERGLKES